MTPARNVLAALLLHTLDVGTSLYGSPDAMPTAEMPGEFVEVNIWRALETAAHGLSDRASTLRLASGPTQVATGASAFGFYRAGRAHDFWRSFSKGRTPSGGTDSFQPAALDPTFWEWSFLWTRWLLGKNAAAPLQPLLEEKNQRWGWYGEALTNAFADMAKFARPGGQCVMAFPSGSHAMIEALMLASFACIRAGGFCISTAPRRNGFDRMGRIHGDYQAVWKNADMPAGPRGFRRAVKRNCDETAHGLAACRP